MEKELLNKLSQAQFKRPFNALKKRETEFIKHLGKQYRKYQDLARAQALEIMGKKKLSSREYKIIEEWFLKGIPFHVVHKALADCLEQQRGSGRAIYSLAFFKCHVVAGFRAYLRLQIGSRVLSDPWGYDEWR